MEEYTKSILESKKLPSIDEYITNSFYYFLVDNYQQEDIDNYTDKFGDQIIIPFIKDIKKRSIKEFPFPQTKLIEYDVLYEGTFDNSSSESEGEGSESSEEEQPDCRSARHIPR